MIQKLKKAMNRHARTSMKIVYAYSAGLILMVALLIAAWLFNWYTNGKPDIPQLLQIFKEYKDQAMILAVGFIIVLCIDKNHDGRPDVAEREAKKDSPPRPPERRM
jgi:hypothetical protein